jgi:hypothetical protein
MNLLALQRSMVDHLVRGATDISSQVRDDAAPRLAVYHNAYRMQLLACLRDTFEKTRNWLGDAQFDPAGVHYIETHPPASWTLNDYGQDFGESLGRRHPNDAEVAELAWLDWSLRRAFDGPDTTALTQDRLANIDWDHATLRLVPTLRMTSIATNCAAIWTAMAAGETPPAAARLPEAMALRVWRQELTPRFRSIDPGEQRALFMASKGARFAMICEMLAEGREYTEASALAGTYLVAWLQDGLLIAID